MRVQSVTLWHRQRGLGHATCVPVPVRHCEAIPCGYRIYITHHYEISDGFFPFTHRMLRQQQKAEVQNGSPKHHVVETIDIKWHGHVCTPTAILPAVFIYSLFNDVVSYSD
jgi:hypothetical protein